MLCNSHACLAARDKARYKDAPGRELNGRDQVKYVTWVMIDRVMIDISGQTLTGDARADVVAECSAVW